MVLKKSLDFIPHTTLCHPPSLDLGGPPLFGSGRNPEHGRTLCAAAEPASSEREAGRSQGFMVLGKFLIYQKLATPLFAIFFA